MIPIIILIGVFFLYRNHSIYVFRQRLVHEIALANITDIILGSEKHRVRWSDYESVSYNSMMIQFWRPLKSFYKDKPLIESLLKRVK